MVQFSFLNRLEKIGILEFCCTSFRELLFSFYLCALPIKFALPAGCRQSSQAREGRTTQLLFFSCCKVSLSTVELQHEWIQNLPKMSLIPPEMKRNLKKEKKRANQSDWVLQQGIPSAALFMKGGQGSEERGGWTVKLFKNPIFCCARLSKRTFWFVHIGPYVSATSIHIFIII